MLKIPIIFLLVFFICNISSNYKIGIKSDSGKYYMECDENSLRPYIYIYENSEFEFSYDPLSSYLSYGNYYIDNNKLIAKTYDGKYKYIFEIEDNETLRFLKDKSSSVLPIKQDFVAEIIENSLFKLE